MRLGGVLLYGRCKGALIRRGLWTRQPRSLGGIYEVCFQGSTANAPAQSRAVGVVLRGHRCMSGGVNPFFGLFRGLEQWKYLGAHPDSRPRPLDGSKPRVTLVFYDLHHWVLLSSSSRGSGAEPFLFRVASSWSDTCTTGRGSHAFGRALFLWYWVRFLALGQVPGPSIQGKAT